MLFVFEKSSSELAAELFRLREASLQEQQLSSYNWPIAIDF